MRYTIPTFSTAKAFYFLGLPTTIVQPPLCASPQLSKQLLSMAKKRKTVIHLRQPASPPPPKKKDFLPVTVGLYAAIKTSSVFNCYRLHTFYFLFPSSGIEKGGRTRCLKRILMARNQHGSAKAQPAGTIKCPLSLSLGQEVEEEEEILSVVTILGRRRAARED